MDLSGNLQIKPGATVDVLHRPSDIEVELGDGVTVTAGDSADVGPLVAAARAGKLAWVAYPKGGNLGTDLNCDSLNAAMNDNGVQAVGQVSIDEVWSAFRSPPL